MKRSVRYWLAWVLLGCNTVASAQTSTDDQDLETIAVEPIATSAPEATPAPSTSRSAALDEVVVTAQRREERLQEVPIAVTAFSQDDVESRGIQRIDDLNSLSPGLQISRSPANTTISQITIRGSSQINPAIYWDPAVGLYLNGVYIGKSQGSIFDVVDLAGVEVLRGPQGTLYGRNTIGGTINLVTRQPGGEFSGSTALEFGNFAGRVGRVSLDLPRIGDFVNITVAARGERRDGWVDASETSPVDQLNNRKNEGVHIAALFDLAPDLEALYRFDGSLTDQTNNYLQLFRSDDPRLQDFVFQERQTEADINSESFERARIQGHALTLSWAPVDWVTLKSITGYRKVRWEDSLDLDGSPETVAFTQRFTDYEQRSQDLNLSGGVGTLRYVGGVFYFTDDGYTNNPLVFYDGLLNFDSQYGTRTEAWAGYTQLDWQPLDAWTLTAGYRYTLEDKALQRVLGFSPVPGAPFVYFVSEGFETPEKRFSAGTPLATVAWAPSERLNLYLRYAEGFKSGGFNGEYSNLQDTPDDGNDNTRNDNQEQTLTPFEPERQRSLELGAKSSFFNGRVSANLALFRNRLEDLQASIFTGGGGAATVVRNAGKGTVQGVELETAWRAFAATTLRLNYAFLDASYDEFIDVGPPDALGNRSVGNQADNRAFVHAPEHSFNVVLDSVLFETRYGQLRAVADYAWTDAFFTYPYQLANEGDENFDPDKQAADNSRVEAYGLLNARLAWSGIPLGRLATMELALWGRNLLDEDAANNFIDFGPGLFQNLTVANFVEPRFYGLAAVVRW